MEESDASRKQVTKNGHKRRSTTTVIIYVKGDILASNEAIIVHGCNCSGGFGSGIAGQISRKYPEAKRAYLTAYERRWTRLGNYDVVYVNESLRIVNAFTQQKYGPVDQGPYVSYPAIRSIIQQLSKQFPDGFAMPKMGAGLAGGNWEVIEKIINEETPNTPVRVYTLD